MFISEEILKSFNLNQEEVILKIRTVSEILDYLRKCSEKMMEKSDLYQSSQDANIREDCLDIFSSRLNSFTQAYKSLMNFLLEKNRESIPKDPSLGFFIRKYDSIIEDDKQTKKESLFLEKLNSRNQVIHEYFNIQENEIKLFDIMINCVEGSLDVYKSLSDYCKEKGYTEEIVNKDDI